MSTSEDIVKDFLRESSRQLDQFDRDLATLAEHPFDRGVVASAFRTIHTIKGTSGFLAFSDLEAVTDAGETLLARLRDGQLSLNPEIAAALLALVTDVRQILARIEAHGNEGKGDHRQLITSIIRLLAAPGQEAGQKHGPRIRKAEAETGS